MTDTIDRMARQYVDLEWSMRRAITAARVDGRIGADVADSLIEVIDQCVESSRMIDDSTLADAVSLTDDPPRFDLLDHDKHAPCPEGCGATVNNCECPICDDCGEIDEECNCGNCDPGCYCLTGRSDLLHKLEHTSAMSPGRPERP